MPARPWRRSCTCAPAPGRARPSPWVPATHHVRTAVVVGFPHLKALPPPPLRRPPRVDVRDRVPDEIETLPPEPDPSSRAQTGEALAGLTAVDHEDPLAGAQQAVPDGALQALTERQQQHHRERSPGHRKEGEERPGPLRLQVADEFPDEDVEHGYVRSASTGSSAAARRAGIKPATNATTPSSASVATSTVGEMVGTPTNSLIGRPPSPATSPSESNSPSTAPIDTIISASAENWRMMSAPVAPTARRTPISRLRSRTTMYMMFATPMPPTSRVKVPTKIGRAHV